MIVRLISAPLPVPTSRNDLPPYIVDLLSPYTADHVTTNRK